MRKVLQLAKLQKCALTAVKYQDLIAIALYAHSPSMAYRVATELNWYAGKAASCRFLALILRDHGIGKFRSFIRQKNPKAHQELCWCECHREGGHDCDPDQCSSYQDGNCMSDACDNCKCNGCAGLTRMGASITKTEKRREAAEEVPAPIVLPPGRVGRIAQRLFEVAGRGYAVHVFESNDFQAYADGESIGVATGAISSCDDDELAILISHELAHNIFDHPQESYERTSSMLQGVSRAVKYEGILWGIAYGALNHAINCKSDRDSELDADRAAVDIAQRAGFDTSKAPKVFGRLQSKGGLFSTHPSAERRVRNMS